MALTMALVEYQIARDGLPPRRGLAYDYVLAGDGLYLIAQIVISTCGYQSLPFPCGDSRLSTRP